MNLLLECSASFNEAATTKRTGITKREEENKKCRAAEKIPARKNRYTRRKKVPPQKEEALMKFPNQGGRKVFPKVALAPQL